MMGGWSAEREVSLVSGEACAKALASAGYEVRRIDVGRDLRALLDGLDPAPDAAFNALHGTWGEDGGIQGMLDALRIPYTHSGRLASAIAMDKPRSIRLFRDAGLPVARHLAMDIAELRSGGDPMSRPYVVKPAREGSSVGVMIVREGDVPDYGDWPYGLAMVEEYVPGKELTVAVMGDRALGVTELRPKEGFYDYEAKYTDGKTEHLCPAPISTELSTRCMNAALEAHRVLGCRGVTRTDFRYDPDADRLVILETNTQPGMTPLSLAPEQAKHAGISFEELVSWMVENAVYDD